MANKKLNNTTNTKNNAPENNAPVVASIIDVVVNGMTATESAELVIERLASVEKSIFNIALLCAYGTGRTIPAYTDNKGVAHGEATVAKKMKQKDFIKRVGRSKGTISKWCSAMDNILANNYFNYFATGTLPFSYDKINIIFDEKTKEAFTGIMIQDLMGYTADALETMAEDYLKKQARKEESEESAEESAESAESESAEESSEESEESADVEVITLTYNNVQYVVPKQAFEKWLAENHIAK